MRQLRALPLFLLALSLLAAPAMAHFPFIVADPSGNEAKLVLSESLAVDDSVKVERLAGGSKLFVRNADGKDVPLTLAAGDHSMSLKVPGEKTRLVHGAADFGVRQRGEEPAYLLIYYPKAIIGDAFDSKTVVGANVPVELVPARVEGGFKFQLLVAGKPVADREVKIIHPDGVQSTQKTNAEGFTETFVKAGRYGAWARNWVDAPGKRGESAYKQERLYATLVIDFTAANAPIAEAAVQAKPFISLPEGVSSFGAVALDGWLYVYGGHTATTHNYSTATVSGRFQRLNLRDPQKWEELPGGPILQGMNLVAYRGAIYRVGGMSPRNPPGEPKDNNSTAEVARFDPKVGKWEQLPATPVARSSHDVALVGDKLYSIGGWNQQGKAKDNKSAWWNHVDVMDLAAEKKEWKKIDQSFVRRALIVAVLGQDIYVLGGFDEKNQSQLDVDILDTKTNTWRKGPPVPGERRNGFAPAACVLNGTLYLSVSTGEMFKLSSDRSKWELYAKATPRSVHRLIPDGSRILIVGGAANQKMVNLIETVPAAGATEPAASAASER